MTRPGLRLDWILPVLVAGWLGCADALVFGTRTNVGIHARPAKDGQSELDLGYKRTEIVVLPRTPGNGGKPHLYSVFAWLRFTSRWPVLDRANAFKLRRGLCIRQQFATGKAAETLAGARDGPGGSPATTVLHRLQRDPCRE